jgi:hypothetical protein
VFPGLGLKAGSFSLVIWTLKSLRRFFSLCLKIKWASVYQLHHKTDGGRSAWKASLARVSQSDLKIDGCATTGDARGTIVEVASEVS